MNTSKLKSYAPAARRDFIRAVTERAAKIGVSSRSAEPVEVKGDTAFIAGRAFSRQAAEQRKALDLLIKRHGFAAVMEEAAYTWFNRFMAIRYMELHGYLSHGYRVLSSINGGPIPEIMEHAESELVALPGVNRDQVIELKLDGTKDEELYKLLILGQCRAMHEAMPFLFEPIDDVTELLLPDLLLATDSIIRKMVNEIEEENWEQIEVIGWLYQFYISEKKDEVIGSVVASEDIPAATQLFTPNWIVKYMTQNSLGRMWTATYPSSPLKAKMEYYIEPAEQTKEVQEQLEEITPKTLDPEAITLIDPACGSGHILVEAYDLFKGIYLERGYRLRDIPRLILTKNLHGLEIDDRAAQMAGFALLMKARADDRNIFTRPPTLNVLSLQSSAGMDADEISAALLENEDVPFVPDLEMFSETKLQPALIEASNGSVTEQDVSTLLNLFTEAKTFGSLITVPANVAAKLHEITKIADEGVRSLDLLKQHSGKDLSTIRLQANLLAQKYDVVVANPPYMASKYLTTNLKNYLQSGFPGFDKDLFSAFIVRNLSMTKAHGHLGFMSPFVWMFISSYVNLRKRLLESHTLTTLVQLEYSGFDGATVPICTFTVGADIVNDYMSSFVRLSEQRGSAVQGPKALEAIKNNNCVWFYVAKPIDFKKIPGFPIAYWVSDKMRQAFTAGVPLESIAPCRQGLATADNARFLRSWWEVSLERIGFNMASRDEAKNSGKKWFPYNKGGEFRKWYGNNEHVVNWEDDGAELFAYRPISVIRNPSFYFKPSITWTDVSSSYFGVRACAQGFLFDVSGSSMFPEPDEYFAVLGFMASKLTSVFMKVLNPTLHSQVGNVSRLPLETNSAKNSGIGQLVEKCVAIAKSDWDSVETSWDFQSLPLLSEEGSAALSFATHDNLIRDRRTTMLRLETESNRIWIDAYGLQGELSCDVFDDEITLARPDTGRNTRRLISYLVGCLMGRFSLDEPGLVYAHSGGADFDYSRYNSVPMDNDGILPVTEIDWFAGEDTAHRFEQFVAAAWPRETLAENLKFVADSLSPKAGEEPIDTIRRYLATGFYKDHLQTYKKRPIYWLFSSGKERAFQALVYLHRYNEGTLARMRTEYVLPLLSQMSARIESLDKDIEASPSAAERSRRQKELSKLRKQEAELHRFDENLRHYSDRQIKLDLDDGVKVNYGKFGDLLAEVKAITGGNDD